MLYVWQVPRCTEDVICSDGSLLMLSLQRRSNELMTFLEVMLHWVSTLGPVNLDMCPDTEHSSKPHNVLFIKQCSIGQKYVSVEL